jgi:hypothetical protein
LTVQVQQRGRKPHSMMWRSSRVEIMTFVLRVNVYGFMSLIIVSPHHPDSGSDQPSPDWHSADRISPKILQLVALPSSKL